MDVGVDAGENTGNGVLGIDVGPVSAWLDGNVPAARGPYEFEFIAGGHSNLTYKVTGADGKRLVLRRPPLGAVLATAHDMGREFAIITGVGRTEVPVPQALGLCSDESVNGAPFYVMSYVDGVVLHDAELADLEMPDHAAREDLSQSVVDVLAALHTADPDAIGLGDLGRREAYLDRQLKRWKRQWESSKTRELPAMDRAFDLLGQAKPEQRYTGVVHGDYRLGNMLVDPVRGTVEAVLDWELCTLGDVLADIGYILNNWVQPGEATSGGTTEPPTMHGGFSTREELIDRYCTTTGFEVTNADYYRAFQHWRLAAIVEGVMARYLKGVMVDDSVDTDEYRVRVETMADEANRLLHGLG
ncbi:MAG: phosphotransferase family protein [Acidimicrobiia bacterium]|nr:phosphotransferase family protein [Acidimicrobiia bacterium]